MLAKTEIRCGVEARSVYDDYDSASSRIGADQCVICAHFIAVISDFGPNSKLLAMVLTTL